MRANLGEPVEVWLRDGTPARFVWRGRRYTVMFVLDRQFVPAAPLVSPDAPAPAPASTAPASTAPASTAPASTAPADAEPPGAGTGAAGTGAAGTGAGSDCWRVEATPERTLPPATYELCHDLAADRWSLSRD
jgi:hypothetical protein